MFEDICSKQLNMYKISKYENIYQPNEKKVRLAFFATPARIPPGWFTIRAKVPVLVPSTTCKYHQISKDGTKNISKYQKMIQGILTNIKVREYKNFTPPPPRWHERTTSDWVALVAVSQLLPLLFIANKYQDISRHKSIIEVPKISGKKNIKRLTCLHWADRWQWRRRHGRWAAEAVGPLSETPAQHHTWYLSNILHQKIF